jgi:aspartate/methionine/tyrosine aminotransferase
MVKFEKYPFEKLSELLSCVIPKSSFFETNLTVGEPQFQTPLVVQEELKRFSNLLNRYPKSSGENYLKESILKYLKERFNLILSENQIIPTFGTREVLFNFPQFFLFDKERPKMAFPNPFYQIYEGSAIASRAEVLHLNLTKENGFIPKIDREALKDCDLVILNTPNNPTASVMSFEEMQEWIKLALELDFVLLNDECYVDLYTFEAIPSMLEASISVGNRSFKNLLVVNSISKRNSAPGLRSGFIAGDRTILERYRGYRSYVGCASPLPLQRASAVAWEDFNSIEIFRRTYQRNLEIASEILEINMPQATFYIWLEVKDDIKFTKTLYREFNIKVLPGTFLSRDGVGAGYVRLALVYDERVTRESMIKIKEVMDSMGV